MIVIKSKNYIESEDPGKNDGSIDYEFVSPADTNVVELFGAWCQALLIEGYSIETIANTICEASEYNDPRDLLVFVGECMAARYN